MECKRKYWQSGSSIYDTEEDGNSIAKAYGTMKAGMNEIAFSQICCQ